MTARADPSGAFKVTRPGWIAYVGPFMFPWGQASSRRVYGVAQSLARAGHRVVVGSGEQHPRVPALLEQENGGQLVHVGLGELHGTDASVIAKAIRLLVSQGARAVRWLEAQPITPSHVIVYGGYAPFMARIMPWCRRRGVPVIADVVEWYEPSHLPGGRWGAFNASTNIALRWQYPRCDGVIAISAFLERYYAARGVPVIRVPPTLDVSRFAAADEQRTSKCPGIDLVYAGTPGKKDLLPNVIAAVRRLSSRQVRLRVLGVSHEQVVRLVGKREGLSDEISIVGRVPQQEIARAYQDADFSVLARAPLRYAEAGFPTKVTESLAAGVPVICNATGDLAEYIRDGHEGLLCADHSPEALASGFERALSLSVADRFQMRTSARLAAERSFDYRRYSDLLADFLAAVRR
ncbi:glycosyltransferase family 4 protein [Anaeromyxobacter oryzae]|uniref:Glycosyl transferase group 1 n=1 Tax=Anaeromyxobacter oryzae TaxID=2918170 RepID=A0ABN6MR66_9BACT|nr:glycosyltransferase family 4 protein [Anaeromyxobacter oryzae]BDG03440.1 hypothetical protein AMOR_24360 [Anaeromyxobacter oryzae]